MKGAINGLLMHAIDLGDGHKVEFYDFGDRHYGVRETKNVDMADALVLNDAMEGMSLAEIYRQVVADATDASIPRALLEADRILAEPEPQMTEAAAVETVATGERVGVTQQAVAMPPTPPPPQLPCSNDAFGDGWGARWFQDTFCVEGSFRWCPVHWGGYDTDWVKKKWIRTIQMEGDFANFGHMKAWKTWIPNDCWPFTCLRKTEVAWDYDVLPRHVENWLNTGGSTFELKATGWSSCGHGHLASLRK